MFKFWATVPGRFSMAIAQIAAAVIFAGLLSFARGSDSTRASFPELRLPAIEDAAFMQGPQAAPELNIGTDWLNTKKPLSLADLQGRVVLLDFWTLC